MINIYGQHNPHKCTLLDIKNGNRDENPSVFFNASPFFSAWWTRREVSVYPITRVINALKKEVFHVILKSKRFANDYNIFFQSDFKFTIF